MEQPVKKLLREPTRQNKESVEANTPTYGVSRVDDLLAH